MIDDVKAAREGDRAAFSRLVARFQGRAVAYAASWTGNHAGDVAQDAFIEAFLQLHQLREPEAFPAWLRQIVRKHCDRYTRRRGPRPAAEAELEELPATLSAPDLAIDRDWLRGAIGTLPEHERIVVALHYLADEPQQEVAEFLELPLSTVKKRLFSARARLREREVDMSSLKPNERFADRIALFLAIRAGDVGTARAILGRQPELLNAPEQWTAREALDGGLPMAHRVPPLVLAASRGDGAMLEMLLEQGADVEGTCGGANDETALWTASRYGYTSIASALLEAGADPDARNSAGFRPAEAASLRAVERVRVDGTRVETGIKAIDLLAPLELGMLVRVHGQAGTGLMALLAELTSRLGDAVWLSFAEQPWQKNELEAFARDTGIAPSFGGDYRGRSLFVFGEETRQAELDALLPSLREARIAFIIDPWAVATRDVTVPDLAPPFDALLVTDPTLARAGVFPALDRRHTRSKAALSARHARLVAAVRAAEDEGVWRFFHQWFGVWQHRTGQPGELWSAADTLRGFEERLARTG